jgi:hypothetical protein
MSEPVPTAASLHRKARKLDRLIAGAERALELMRRGAVLQHCQKTGWRLDGRPVSSDVAAMVVRNARVSGDGCLFPEIPIHQTYRWSNQHPTNERR